MLRAPGAPLLTVRDLRSYLATDQGVVRAVDGVSFTVGEAEILGIVGGERFRQVGHLPDDRGPHADHHDPHQR